VLADAYASVVKALQHSCLVAGRKLVVEWVEASDLEQATLEANPVEYHTAWSKVCGSQGILVPGGFGTRGIEGKIAAARRARENNIPFLGVCLGLQVAVIGALGCICFGFGVGGFFFGFF
jgi:CTP synthase